MKKSLTIKDRHQNQQIKIRSIILPKIKILLERAWYFIFKLIVEQQLPKHKAINSMALSVGHLATLIRSSKTINQFHLLGTKFPKYDIPPSKSLSDMKTDKAEAKPSDSNSSKELHVSTLNIETSDNPIIASMKHLFTPSDKLQFRIYEARKTSLLNQINYLSLQRELIQICIKFTKKSRKVQPKLQA